MYPHIFCVCLHWGLSDINFSNLLNFQNCMPLYTYQMQVLSINQKKISFTSISYLQFQLLFCNQMAIFIMNSLLLGQVMIDKNPGITSVVNKINNIDNTYRNFQMEVLSGEENMMTKVWSILLSPNIVYIKINV